MYQILILSLMYIGAKTHALSSPFASSIPEISISNAHLTSNGKGKIVRGQAPLNAGEVKQLANYGISEVLILRHDSPGETAIGDELKLLADEPRIVAVHQIPFPWKNITDFRAACRQTVAALNLLKSAARSKGAGLYFHCTVGEDRTGYLAGLYRILFEKGSPRWVFQNEMCAHGYAEGDSGKPQQVVDLIHKSVTPLFSRMVALIESGALNARHLDVGACDRLPAPNRRLPPEALRCRINH